MKKIQTLFSVLTGICLAVVFAVTFGQVIQRYVFQLPMPWATDIIRIFFVYSVFFGMAVAFVIGAAILIYLIFTKWMF